MGSMKNPRKLIIINPAFQLRFAFLFTVAVVVFSAIFPIFVYTMFGAIEQHSYFASNPTALQALREARYDLSIFLLLAFVTTVVSAFSWMASPTPTKKPASSQLTRTAVERV